MKRTKKTNKDNSKSYVYWRKSPEELQGNPNEVVIDTFEKKLEQAQEMVSNQKYDCVLVLKIVKVVRQGKAPVKTTDF